VAKSSDLSPNARISPQDRPDWLAGSQPLRDDSESQHMGTSMKIRMMSALGAALLLAACGSSGSDTGGNMSAADTSGQLSGTNNGVSGTGLDNGVSGSAMGPGSTGEFETKVGNTIHFDTDSYSLNSEAQGILQKQAQWLQQYPQHMVTIEGHADERGTREYNLALGDRRATTVMNYLVALGVDKGRLSEVSYGKEKPVCVDASDSCWNENRRGVTALSN
jgi:peptidoglycan-associated lipoprotein